MSDSSPTLLFLSEFPAAVPFPASLRQARAWVGGAVAGLFTMALLVVAVATQCGADAERMAQAQARAGGLAPLVAGFAAIHGRPGAL